MIVHSAYVEQNARAGGLRRAHSGAFRIRRGRCPHVEAGRRRLGRAAHRLLRLPEHEQADPAAARGVRGAAPRAGPGARLLLVGAAGERFDLSRRLERLGLTDGVDRLDYVPEERMWSLMAACDVLVNLRYPTMGETSGSVIRGLSLGKPLVVSDVGWFAELPDGVVLKVPVDELEVPTLEAALAFAADHAAALGGAARGVRRARARADARRRRLCRGDRGRRRRRRGERRGAAGGSRKRRPRSASPMPRAFARAAVESGIVDVSEAVTGGRRARAVRRLPPWVWVAALVGGVGPVRAACWHAGSSRRGSWSTS